MKSDGKKVHRPDLEVEDHAAIESQISDDFKKILDSRSIVIDVGANLGQFAKEICSIVTVQKIYSFEPVPEAYSQLEKLSEGLSSVVPLNKAVAAVDGSAHFFVTQSDVGSSLLKPKDGQPSKWLTLDKTISVKTTRIDTFIESLPRHEREIALLKSDSQGADFDVLRSCGKYLSPKHIKAVMVEVNFAEFYEGQKAYHEIFALLDMSGYRMARFHSHRAHDEWLWWADVLFVGE